jgi:hypothetical protein
MCLSFLTLSLPSLFLLFFDLSSRQFSLFPRLLVLSNPSRVEFLYLPPISVTSICLASFFLHRHSHLFFVLFFFDFASFFFSFFFPSFPSFLTGLTLLFSRHWESSSFHQGNPLFFCFSCCMHRSVSPTYVSST